MDKKPLSSFPDSAVFVEYTPGQKKPDTYSKKEFQDLIRKELEEYGEDEVRGYWDRRAYTYRQIPITFSKEGAVKALCMAHELISSDEAGKMARCLDRMPSLDSFLQEFMDTAAECCCAWDTGEPVDILS